MSADRTAEETPPTGFWPHGPHRMGMITRSDNGGDMLAGMRKRWSGKDQVYEPLYISPAPTVLSEIRDCRNPVHMIFLHSIPHLGSEKQTGQHNAAFRGVSSWGIGAAPGITECFALLGFVEAAIRVQTLLLAQLGAGVIETHHGCHIPHSQLRRIYSDRRATIGSTAAALLAG